MHSLKIALGVLLALGLGVAILSAYKASVAGVMKQVGLVGSDFSVAVVKEKIAKAVTNTQSTLSCDLPTRIQGAVKFMYSSDTEQGRLAFRLGESRIQCGARMLANDNVENGTYEIIKGMGYLTQGYHFVQERIVADSGVCEGLPSNELSITMNQILDATSGKVYELIWNDWQEVNKLRTEIDSRCVDQRMQTR